MVSEATPVSNLVHYDVLSLGDSLVVSVANGGLARQGNASSLFSNSSLPLVIGNLVIPISAAPANSTVNCSSGQVSCDGNNVYVAIANNVLKRVQLSSF